MYIYKLTKNEIPFYIGRTGNLKSRLLDHKKNYGNNIKMIEIDNCDYLDSVDLESYYINQYLKDGYILKNKHINTTSKIKQKKILKYIDEQNKKKIKVKKIIVKSKRFIIDKKHINKIKHGDLTNISKINNINYRYIYAAYQGRKTTEKIFNCFICYLE